MHDNGAEGQQMKLLLISHNLNLEGAPKSLLALGCGLSSMYNCKVFVWSPSDGPLRDDYNREDIHVSVGFDGRSIIDFNSFFLSKNYDNYSNNVWSRIDCTFSKYFEKHGVPDVIIANTILNFWAISYFQSRNIPVVWIIRESEGMALFNGSSSSVLSQVSSAFVSCARVIFVAQETRDVYLRDINIQNYSVINNGLNGAGIFGPLNMSDRRKLRTDHGFSDEDFVIFNCGTFCDRKNQKELVDAFLILHKILPKESSLKLLLVGAIDNNYAQELIQYVRRVFPENSVHGRNIINFVDSSKDVHKYYQISDVFAFCSRLESFPRVVMEAMASGLPIVTAPNMGIHSQVMENENALFYELGNPHDLALKLVSYISDRQKLHQHGQKSIDLASKKFSYDDMLQNYHSVLKNVSSITQGYLS